MDRALMIWRGPLGRVVNGVVYGLALAGAIALCYLGITEFSPSRLVTYAVQVSSQKDTRAVVGAIKTSSQAMQHQTNAIESQTRQVAGSTAQMADYLAKMQAEIAEMAKQNTAARRTSANLAQLRLDFTKLQRTYERSELANDKLRAEQEQILLEAIRKLDRDLAAHGEQQ